MGAWRAPSRGIRVLDGLSRRPFSSSRALGKQYSVSELLRRNDATDQVEVHGWIRSVRKQKRIAFAVIGDGSTIQPLQAVLKPDQASALSYGTAVKFTGSWQVSGGSKQSHELQVASVRVLGENDAESSPVQAKYQTPEFLRTIPHLRARIPGNALLLRLRSQVIAALTQFFHREGFVQTHTPVITSSDCEGAGEVFVVSSNVAQSSEGEEKSGKKAAEEPFFRTTKYLTVSAQLHLEALAQAVSKVWTLSPTFRAEQSDTPRHLSEFYMLEGEMCFVDDMNTIMDLIERMLRAAAIDVMSSDVGKELLILRQTSHSNGHDGDSAVIDEGMLQRRWDGMASDHWPRITYANAVQILQAAHAEGQTNFTFEPTYEGGLQAEHERYIAEKVGQGAPVFVTDYPRAQKPFYMPGSTARATSANGDEGSDTVACFDLLVPDLCELVGGSMREFRLEELQASMRSKDVMGSGLEWYQDLRRYGSVPHGGFGLGFDRLLCYLSGIGSVRDMVAFPRYYGRCDC